MKTKSNMTDKPKCYDYIDGYDTAGKSIIKRKCFCNTTVCQNYGEEETIEQTISRLNYGNFL
jgi:hypothetical protein